MKRALSIAAVLAAASALSGCISLFPKTEPSQLYRFDYRAASAATPSCDRDRAVGVIVSPPEFPRAAGTDQLLTFAGDEAAFISSSRWVSPARNLFEDAVEEAFLQSCAVRLVRRQDFGAGSARLRLDVDRFEAVYPAGTAQTGKAAAAAPPPVITVSFKATITKRGGDFGAERFFKASQPAMENRVGPIVAAYSAASTKALSELTAWTDTQAVRIAAEQDGPSPAIARPAPPLPAGALRGGSSTTTTTSSSSTTTQKPR